MSSGPPTGPGNPWLRDNPWVVVLAAVLLVGIGVGAFFAVDSGGKTSTSAASTTTQATTTQQTTTTAATTTTTAETTTQQATTEATTTEETVTQTAPVTTTATTTTAQSTTAPAPPPPAASKPTVPSVMGQNMTAAVETIDKAGYYADTSPLVRKGARIGTVARQQPRAGKKLAHGSPVRLAIATGKKIPPNATIPDVVGMNADDARAKLLGLKLTVATKFRKATGGQVGKVIAQSAPPGTVFRQYFQVLLLVGQ